jgi:hypothetical protein
MSKETEWLNAKTLIGFTKKRGNAWHYRADWQSAEPNHYPGPVPVKDVRRRLFNWDPESWEVYARKPGPMRLDIAGLLTQPDNEAMISCILGALGLRHQENRQAITRSDNEHVMGIFTDDYVPHPYDEWLLTTVANILDDDLHIGSAGLLRGGAGRVGLRGDGGQRYSPRGCGVPAVPAGYHRLRRIAVDHLRPQGQQRRLRHSLGESVVVIVVVGLGAG